MRSKLEPPLPKPPWLRIDLKLNDKFASVNSLVKNQKLHTVCQEARCPNMFECWANGTATFLLMGEVCTRHCTFCAIKKGAPPPLDNEEPYRIAKAVQNLKLKHAVITSVNRDDLPDGGASHFAATVQAIRELNPKCTVEVLIPDFQGNNEAFKTVIEASPEILNHNMETVTRLYRRVRPNANYNTSLELLKQASAAKKQFNIKTKSGFMIGVGETKEEIFILMDDLRKSDCDILTIGQYLRPTINNHLPVEKYYTPEEFKELKQIALNKGFKHVESAPLIRSSYHAHKQIKATASL